MGNRKTDIVDILGEVNGLVFIQTVSRNQDISIDVLKDFSLYAVLKIKNTEEVLSCDIKHDQFIVNLKNDELGPYATIYDIKIEGN